MKEAESTYRTITIQVTEEDISKGVCGSPFRCPVATAISRHLRDDAVAWVGDSITLLTCSSSDILEFKVELPRSVEEFIREFDHYGPEKVRPFSFQFKLPEWILKREME